MSGFLLVSRKTNPKRVPSNCQDPNGSLAPAVPRLQMVQWVGTHGFQPMGSNNSVPSAWLMRGGPDPFRGIGIVGTGRG